MYQETFTPTLKVGAIFLPVMNYLLIQQLIIHRPDYFITFRAIALIF